jgi:hypothetical protein
MTRALAVILNAVSLYAVALDLRQRAVQRRKANRWFKKGTIYRRVMDVLRPP